MTRTSRSGQGLRLARLVRAAFRWPATLTALERRLPKIPVGHPSGPVASGVDVQEILLTEYVLLREDDREASATYATLFTLAAALLGAAVAALATTNLDIPPWLYPALPILPLSASAFVAGLAGASVVRSYYLRRLEQLLHATDPSALSSISPDSVHRLRVPSALHILGVLNSPRSELFAFRVIPVALFAPLVLLVLTVTVWSIFETEPAALQIAATVFYAPILALLGVVLTRITFSGRSLWYEILGVVEPRLELDYLKPRSPRDRHLVTNLALPRFLELIQKGLLYMAVGVTIGYILARPTEVPLGDAIVAFIGFELLIYQARYLINDIRNLDEDKAHPSGGTRRRLPVDLSPVEIMVAMTSAVVRAAIGFWVLATFLEGSVATAAVAAGIAALVIAVVYESAKDRSSARGPDARFTVAALVIYIDVGLGYAVRGALALWIGSGGLSILAIVLLAAMLALNGIMFVLMTWVLDGAALLDRMRDSQQALVEDWSGRRPVWPTFHVDDDTGRTKRWLKPHYAPLLRAAGWIDRDCCLRGDVNERRPSGGVVDDEVVPRVDAPPPCNGGGFWYQCLQPFKEQSTWWAPWNLALLASAVLAGLAGWASTTGMLDPTAWLLVAVILPLTVALPGRSTATEAILVVMAAAVVAVAAFAQDVPLWFLAPVPVLLVHGTYVQFAHMTEAGRKKATDDFHRAARALIFAPNRMAVNVLRAIFGAPAVARTATVFVDPSRRRHDRGTEE